MPWPFFIFVYLYFFCAFCPAHDFFLICNIYPYIRESYEPILISLFAPLKRKRPGIVPPLIFIWFLLLFSF